MTIKKKKKKGKETRTALLLWINDNELNVIITSKQQFDDE